MLRVRWYEEDSGFVYSASGTTITYGYIHLSAILIILLGLNCVGVSLTTISIDKASNVLTAVRQL